MEERIIYDGDYQILFSGSFLVYENKLTIIQIAGNVINFIFEKDLNDKSPKMNFDGDTVNHIVNVHLINFDNNVLGTATTIKTQILNLPDGKNIYFAIHVKNINDSVSFLDVDVTFYIK